MKSGYPSASLAEGALIYDRHAYNAMRQQGDNDTSVTRGSAIEKAGRWDFYGAASHSPQEGDLI